ncbi:unnamed protein product [Paramecium sonneborni]|uniref:Uncharacterized protein n=1 Tax=Paramecium sonneborni TaxID=65129 RepID=A0A8S1P7W0_9CILI|nr:unnamed protein product [Paramecium sonneborni]
MNIIRLHYQRHKLIIQVQNVLETEINLKLIAFHLTRNPYIIILIFCIVHNIKFQLSLEYQIKRIFINQLWDFQPESNLILKKKFNINILIFNKMMIHIIKLYKLSTTNINLKNMYTLNLLRFNVYLQFGSSQFMQYKQRLQIRKQLFKNSYQRTKLITNIQFI